MYGINDWLLGGNKSIWHMRLNDIKKQLEKHNITACVHRHTFFSVDYYCVGQIDNKQKWNENDIAKALDIPLEWVDLGHYEDLKANYCVKEKELNDLYFDKNTRLRFNHKNDKSIKYDDTETCIMYSLSDLIDDIYR